MFGLPSFVFYLISGTLGAFAISMGRFVGQKYIPHFPDMPLLLGNLLAKGKSDRSIRLTGRYTHLVSGALWGLLFGTLVDKQFVFSEFSVAQGILFAFIPWIFMMLVLKPLTGNGFFGIKISNYRWLTSLALHVVYGVVLGLLLSIFTK